MALTKAELVDSLMNQLKLEKKEATDHVELLFELMKEQLVEKKKLKLSGFGNFEVKKKNSRRGRNPQTGEQIQIESRNVLGFKPSQILKDLVSASLADKPIESEEVRGAKRKTKT